MISYGEAAIIARYAAFINSRTTAATLFDKRIETHHYGPRPRTKRSTVGSASSIKRSNTRTPWYAAFLSAAVKFWAKADPSSIECWQA